MAKKYLLSESSDSSSSDFEDGGASLGTGGTDFKVNEVYAKKFEHNKKREEKQRLEEKLGQETRKRKRDDGDNDLGSDSDESTSESEDEGELDTEAIDAEMMATINAIRSKDARIYDPQATFYASINDEDNEQPVKAKKEKPLHLQDYHRQNLLNRSDDEEDAVDDAQPLTYNQEQEELKNDIVQSIHAVAADSGSDEDDSLPHASKDDFLVAKKKKKRTKAEPTLDVEDADKDPETFLSNFMSSRAWTQADAGRNLVPFESDDEEEERRADEFEEAYNMRFEDPAKSNEKLRSHARDMASRYSVRRDEVNPRQKRREADKAKKALEKEERKEDKARLRRLRTEEVEEKVRRIKRAAGLKTKDLKPEDWSRFVDDDWDDAKWEEEMQRRFGEDYYAEQDLDSSDEVSGEGKKKPKKPKFDDEIDIKDIIPGYQDEDEQPEFSLSEDEAQPKKAKKQSHKQAAAESKRESRKDRRLIEQLVDDQLQYDLDASLRSEAQSTTRSIFRYRDTSPTSFGLSSRDILLADDSQLNQYAGLKKLAAFRDPDKKRKDQKHLGKKARLRKWRQDTFGNEGGVETQDLALKKASADAVDKNDDIDEEDGGVDIVEGGRKKKRRRKNKQKTGESEI